jgi:hypothetical protein
MSEALETGDAETVEFPTVTERGCAQEKRVKVGRKHLDQSRSNEIRARLAEWKSLPESSRPTLRALAQELGTSHQLLSHYLQGWEKWQGKEYRRQAKELRGRALTETRPWVMDELMKQAEAYDQAAFQCMISSMLEDLLGRIERDAKVGCLKAVQVKMLRVLASRGDRRAQKLLDKLNSAKKSQNNLPLTSTRTCNSFRRAKTVGGNSAKTARGACKTRRLLLGRET